MTGAMGVHFISGRVLLVDAFRAQGFGGLLGQACLVTFGLAPASG